MNDLLGSGRSPLNVVHVGLELLRSELEGYSNNLPTLLQVTELIDDMHSASEIAINTLSDLLHYENLDAGSFLLETGWRPLCNLFRGKLKWAGLLARRKNVSFHIEDSTILADEIEDSMSKLEEGLFKRLWLNSLPLIVSIGHCRNASWIRWCSG